MESVWVLYLPAVSPRPLVPLTSATAADTQAIAGTDKKIMERNWRKKA